MANRTSEKESVHNEKVKEIAEDYKSRHWDTKADLPDYEKPDTIYGYIPDVQAMLSDKWEEIVEVETEDSIESDKDQIAAFKRYADEHPNTEFKLVMAD